MARRRSSSPTRTAVPPALLPIVRAAQTQCPSGHADALAALLILASQKVPARGIFDPGVRDEPDFYLEIETVAKAHLEFGEARAAWRKALKAANLGIDLRDDIEAAALDVAGISDTAYFYTGLAFGLVFASPWRASP
jgi:hypothetical protein